MDGVAIVISPLIALMKNQVDAMRTFSADSGIAHFLNSSLNKTAVAQVRADVLSGKTKLLYFAPESLTKEDNVAFLHKIKVSFYAIDEAHCISQWGQDFRPSYLKILDFLASLPQRPLVSAFTATATAEVRDDIIRALGLEDPFVITTGFDRPNLYFAVEKPSSKPSALLAHLLQRRDKSGIVYCSTRKTVEEKSEAKRS